MSNAVITERILWIREQRILLDVDLARLYGVTTKSLLQAVKRNGERFPADFAFQLDTQEWEALRSQFVTSNSGRGGRRYAPYAFTEQGVAMLSSVLNSSQAIAVNIEIMRAFVRLRQTIASNKELEQHLRELESRVDSLEQETRTQFKQIFLAIRALAAPQEPAKKRPIGFVTPEK